MSELSERDLERLSETGMSVEQIQAQIETFREGIPFVTLEKAAFINDGITVFSDEERQKFIRLYEESLPELRLLKFVPASGAASRMFKMLFHFLDQYQPGKEPLAAYLERNGDMELSYFFDHLAELPFYEIIYHRIKGKASSAEEERYLFVKEMLLEKGCNYGFYPKGLLPFHNYGNYVATPFEEHLKEAARYASSGGEAYVHFTISPQHGPLYNREFSAIKERVSYETKNSFHISYSYQKPSTDTIAVTMENEPYRDEEGALLFRPGGHGALIENLDEQEADLVFIKNIDNVVVPEYFEKVDDNKKVLAGYLLEIQKKAFGYARNLEGNSLNGEELSEIRFFLESRLNIRFSDKFSTCNINQQIEILKDKINRPIRVCGMVKNAGEPGGGPFWIRDSQGNISLQIVESAQVDHDHEKQMEIFRNATHFNPVDMVCGVRNQFGEKYPLLNYIDKKQGFITLKTIEGVRIKALELPGLWNGAMAYWNTLFVEVPLDTFNPVKTVNDLFKPAHQTQKGTQSV